MNKIEIELTDDQLEKVKKLEEQNISVGEAIDMLFEVKDETLSLADALDEDIKIFDSFKIDKKAEILDENFGDGEKTYEMIVQDRKHKVSWAKDIFKF